MRLETFFEKFQLLADAPDALPRLRRLVLDFAVRGKLARQDAGDEPASALLDRVREQKARLEAAGEIKKQEQLPPIAEDAIAFPLPSGWKVSQLGEVAVCLDYMREPINGAERELRIAGKSESDLYPYFGATQQQGWIDDFIFDSELVLLGEDGVPFFDDLRRKAYLISGKSWVNNHAHVFRGVLISNRFLMHWLNTFDYSGRVAGSTRSKLNQARALDIPVPVPPLAEQERIVAKVDELMALCDRLEAQQQERQTRHAALARASLSRFADAPTPANLDFLFQASYSVESADLRRTILSLAIQGKLVPQEPSDEPAHEAIDLVRREAHNAASSGVIRRLGPEIPIDDSHLSELPPGWRWTRIVEVVRPIPNALKRGPFGSAIRKDMFVPSGFKVYEQQHAISGDFGRGRYYIGADKFEELRSFEVRPGDVLISCSGTVGKVAIAPADIERGIINQALLKISLHQSALTNEYFLILFPAFFMETETLSNLSGTAQKNIPGMEVLKAMPFPLPPLEEQHRIVAAVNRLMGMVDLLEAKIAAYHEAGTALMNSVVGEITGQA